MAASVFASSTEKTTAAYISMWVKYTFCAILANELVLDKVRWKSWVSTKTNLDWTNLKLGFVPLCLASVKAKLFHHGSAQWKLCFERHA